MAYAVLFPGQGSQFVGMGVDLFDRYPEILGSTADDVLGWSLRQVCLEGPEDTLTRTEHAQPALFAIGYARWLELSAEIDMEPAAAAGHSLGEYTALCASGAIDYSDCLQIVALRGRLMAEAADGDPSGMAALLGASEEVAEGVIGANRDQGGRLQVANYNAPGQIVVAGSAADLEWLADNGHEYGVRRSIPLKVASAFHSDFMTPAAEGLKAGLSGIEFSEPHFPVWSNVTAAPHEAPTIGDQLVAQVTSPVRFSSSLRSIADQGVGTYIHVGPGEVTAGLARKTLDDATVLSFSTSEDLAGVKASMGTMGPNEV